MQHPLLTDQLIQVTTIVLSQTFADQETSISGHGDACPWNSSFAHVCRDDVIELIEVEHVISNFVDLSRRQNAQKTLMSSRLPEQWTYVTHCSYCLCELPL
jgi:hypothetical protein